jgi:hypothetical protein
MNNPYDLYFWSKLYRNDAIAKAQRRYFAEQAKAGREKGRLPPWPSGVRGHRTAWCGRHG